MNSRPSTAATRTETTAGNDTARPLLKRRIGETPGKAMDMDGVEGVSMRLLVGRDDGAPTFAMRHFTVEPGGHTPRHQHNYEHEVLVLSGCGRVEYGGDVHAVEQGDVLLIEPNVLHQFVNADERPFEFICLVPVTHDCGQPTPGS